mgnify:CR=1 FL=1
MHRREVWGTRSRAGRALVAAVALLWLVAGQVMAQSPSPDQINAIARQLSCPTCTGINVADCPTELCVEWRAEIGNLLAQGKSEREILDYFAARYGDHVLQTPPARGVFLWVWLLPALAILAGLVALAVYVKRQHARSSLIDVAELDEARLDEEYLRRVEQDLEQQRK